MCQPGTSIVSSGTVGALYCKERRPLEIVLGSRDDLRGQSGSISDSDANSWCCCCCSRRLFSVFNGHCPERKQPRGFLYGGRQVDGLPVRGEDPGYYGGQRGTSGGRYLACIGFQFPEKDFPNKRISSPTSHKAAKNLVNYDDSLSFHENSIHGSKNAVRGKIQKSDTFPSMLGRSGNSTGNAFMTDSGKDAPVSLSTLETCRSLYERVVSSNFYEKVTCQSSQTFTIPKEQSFTKASNGQELFTCPGDVRNLLILNDDDLNLRRRTDHIPCDSHTGTCLCANILQEMNNSQLFQSVCSKIARCGYFSRGRGGVLLSFKTPGVAESWSGFSDNSEELEVYLSYITRRELPFTSGRMWYEYLYKSYDPDRIYIFVVSVNGHQVACCNRLSSDVGNLNVRDTYLVNGICAKQLRYDLRSLQTAAENNDPRGTLILTPVPGLQGNADSRRAREVCFTNIQQKLRQRGVSLRHQYPEIYRRLCAYTEKNEEFAPVSLFPVNVRSGKSFLCLIMPNSEPICTWIEEYKGKYRQEIIV